jgi:hypothetical protein
MSMLEEFEKPYREAARRLRGQSRESQFTVPATLYLMEQNWKAHTEEVRAAVEGGRPPPPPLRPPSPASIVNDVEAAVDKMHRRLREPSRSGRIRKLLPDMKP